jgi:alpha-galactosidase
MTRWLSARHAGVLLVVDVTGPHLPRIVYWGMDWPAGELVSTELDELPGSAYTPPTATDVNSDVPLTVSPSRAQGWTGWPGLTGHRAGRATQPLFELAGAAAEDGADGTRISYRGIDTAAGLRLDGELELTVDGVLRHRQTLTSTATADADPYVVDDLITLLPVPEHVVDLVDHGGRWSLEAQEQRVRLEQGTWLRETRRGRTGPDSPLVLAAGTAGVGYRSGEAWGVHLGWSGDQRYLAQRLNTGQVVLGAGEILAAGEVILGPGDSLATPWVYGAYSAEGRDGVAQRMHAWLRRRPGHPTAARPITLNTWEAVYFEQSYDRLAELADISAGIGVERFVVDDGWFGGRRGPDSGLGDWTIAADVWPDNGLHRLAAHVHDLGMQFGLWFEPEMVNLDSNLAREQPDWVLGTAGRLPPAWRSQQALDIANPAAYDYLLERMTALVGELGIDYIKWDYNRDVADPVHRGSPRAGRPAGRELTLAAYRLMAELRRRHPGLQIESCSSGGARIDFGVLTHTDRVWASDCIDPLERVKIILGVVALLPFELIGAHVGAPRSHTTGRYSDLAVRCAVAAFGHAGFEWDLTTTSPDERGELARWVAFVKSLRPLLRTGQVVRVERTADPGTILYGVVAADGQQALFNLARLHTSPRIGTAPVRLAGLRPELGYRVHRVQLPGEPAVDQPAVVASGAQLMQAGLPGPTLLPEQVAQFHLNAEP